MARRKSSKKPARKKKIQKRSLGWLGTLFLLSVIVVTLAVVALDAFVLSKFEGAKWALPAHVYSRSLDIFEGLAIKQKQLQWELDKLGYRPVANVKHAGQYRVAGSSLTLYTRPFRFWDGDEPSRKIKLTFSSAGIIGLSGRVPLVRLEPLLIGGIYPSHQEDRILVRLEDLPPYLIDGLLAVEDRNFYQHWGISPKGIARALVSNVKSGSAKQGGSTITQQLVKNFYLSQDRNLVRKGLEAMMAVLLELHTTKAEILEAYLNEVYLGQSGKRAIHGFGMASQHLFRQPIGELELHQVALMLGMVKGASYYDPWRNPKRAKTRRNLVIDLMLAQQLVSANQAISAKQHSLDISAKPGTISNPFPAYFQLVKKQLAEHYQEQDLRSAGLRIFTHLDPQVQRQVERSVSRVLGALEKGYKLPVGQLEAASLVVRVGTADVLAVAGGRKAGYDGYNRAVDARRQVGSTIKPVIYLSALEQPDNYTLSTLIDDGPYSVKGTDGKVWNPQNYEHRSHGLVPLYEALGQSYNQATARLGMSLGLDTVIQTLRRLGYDGPAEKVPSLLLGAIAMSPYDVAGLYHTIAAEGFHTPLRTISAVYTSENEPLQRYPFVTEQRFTPQSIHLLQYALQVVTREGTGKTAYRKLPDSVAIAGKTGTSNGQRDSWFSGFSGNYVNVVWVGRDDNGKMPLTGGTGALQIWADTMAGLNVLSIPFVKPEGIDYFWVEPKTQQLSGEGCRNVRYLPYVKGSAPMRKSPCYKSPLKNNVIDWFKDMFGL